MAKRKEPSKSFALRLTATTLQKLGWFAVARGVNLAEAARIAIHDAVKDAKPPQSVETCQFQVDEAKGRAFTEACAKLGVAADEIIDTTIVRMIRHAFGTAPKMRNGKLHWKTPTEPGEESAETTE